MKEYNVKVKEITDDIDYVTKTDSYDIGFKIDFLLKSHSNIQDLIKSMDNKAYILLVMYGFIISVCSTCVNKTAIDALLNYPDFHLSILVLLASFGFSMVLEAYFLFIRVFKPRLSGKTEKNKMSVYYFDHINQMTEIEFCKKINSMDSKTLLNDLSIQIKEISLILSKKIENIIIATNIMLLSIILLFLLMYMTLFMVS